VNVELEGLRQMINNQSSYTEYGTETMNEQGAGLSKFGT
jgi:hypothetical protein